MKNALQLLIIILFTSIGSNKCTAKEIFSSKFQKMIDSFEVSGSILIYDTEEDIYYSNDYDWAKSEHLPASTFKIPNTIIALETGVIENDSTLLKWDGSKRFLKIWEEDMTVRNAYQLSCVPCYREIARKIGLVQMKDYLNKFEYGSMEFDSSNLDMFWLEGNSKISQFGQINFLKKFYYAKLDVSDRTYEIMKRIMLIENDGNYTLSGKTGLSNTNGANNGWYVGYLEIDKKVYFFAVNLEPKEGCPFEQFVKARTTIIKDVFREMNVIK